MVRYGDLFWKALVLTVVVFLLGVFLGYSLEKNRIKDIQTESQKIDLKWDDARLQSLYYQNLEPRFCNSAIEENLNFADKAYQEGLKIEEYEQATFLTNDLVLEKKKYSLLKVEFWLNSIVLRERCKADYINLVYFFENNPNIDIEAKQESQSEILKELKDKYGKKLMLIPLPIDEDISMINIMVTTYNISSVPTILINEKRKLEGLQSLEDLDAVIGNP